MTRLAPTGRYRYLFVLALSVCTLACDRTIAPADRVAEIDEEPIPYAAFEDFLARNSVDGAGVLGSDVLSSLLDQFLDERLLCQLASDRLGLSEIADGRAAASALLPENLGKPDDRAVTAHYLQHRARFDLPARIYLRQLLFTERELAERTRAQWAAGTPYQDVVAGIADNPAAHAGEEGEFAREDLPPPFADHLFAFDEGTVSEVLAADYGLHVFQVVRHLPAGEAALSEVAPLIREELVAQERQRAMTRLVEEARGRYNVRVFERNVPFNYQGVFDSNLEHETN